jgi:energy-coupling factor transporter ATP-binding protein EcfA2
MQELSLEEKLITYANNNLNVLFIGHPGVGKTTIVKAISEKLKLKFEYYSASTLDPFTDLVGIPVPNKDTKTIEYFQSKKLLDAEFIFFDELNRPQNEKVLNSILEILQFKTINGTPLPKLKLIWAAMNPSGEGYNVDEVDHAIVDRFHCYIKKTPEVDLDYLATKMNPGIAKVIKYWWDSALSEEQKIIFTPRRVEYLGIMIDKDIPWRDALPIGHSWPISVLEEKLDVFRYNGIEITKESILKNVDHFSKKIKENPKMMIQIAENLKKCNLDEFIVAADLIELLPPDLINEIFKRKFPGHNEELLKNIYFAKGTDKYPKIEKALMPHNE